MQTITSTHVDRLVAALGRQGLALRRSKALEALACTFGYADSNVLAVAATDGELDVLQGSLVSASDTTAVINDPVAGLEFSMSLVPLRRGTRDRASDLVVSPYGNLLGVGGIRDALTRDDGEPAATGPSMEDEQGQPCDSFIALMHEAMQASTSHIRIVRSDVGVDLVARRDGVYHPLRSLEETESFRLG